MPKWTFSDDKPSTSHICENLFQRLRSYHHIGQNLFRLIKVINRINSRSIRTRTSEKEYHWKKVDHDYSKKNAWMVRLIILIDLNTFRFILDSWSPEKFTYDILMVCRQKIFIFGVSKAFMSNFNSRIFTKENWSKIAEEVYLRFFLRPLDFSLDTLKDSNNFQEYLLSYEKTNHILLPLNYFMFSVVIKIAHESLWNTKKGWN